MDEEKFLIRLYDVISKLSLISSTRYTHLLEYLTPITENSPEFEGIRITGDRKQFLEDIEYRIEILRNTWR